MINRVSTHTYYQYPERPAIFLSADIIFQSKCGAEVVSLTQSQTQKIEDSGRLDLQIQVRICTMRFGSTEFKIIIITMFWKNKQNPSRHLLVIQYKHSGADSAVSERTDRGQ